MYVFSDQKLQHLLSQHSNSHTRRTPSLPYSLLATQRTGEETTEVSSCLQYHRVEWQTDFKYLKMLTFNLESAEHNTNLQLYHDHVVTAVSGVLMNPTGYLEKTSFDYL